MEDKKSQSRISLKKREANQRNAQKSTGPKTPEGKARSRRNPLKHGILASVLLITKEEDEEDAAEFQELLGTLSRDLAPVGALEELWVGKIAISWWRQNRALKHELELVPQAFDGSGSGWYNADSAEIQERHSLVVGAEFDRILRYQTTIQRELVYCINQLERLQRARKGEHVPAPVSV